MAPNNDTVRIKHDEKHIVSIEDDDVTLDRLLDSFDLEKDKEENKLKRVESSKSLRSILKTGEPTSDLKEIDASQTLDNSLSSIDYSISDSRRRTSMRRSSSVVSFKTVEIREYERTLGDNPACSCGPPISLDWSYSKEEETCINKYEKMKTRTRSNSGTYLRRMGKPQRLNLLQNHLGFTEDEIKAATDERKSIQRGRAVTRAVSQFWRVEDAVQSAGRKMKKAINKGRKSETDLLRLSASGSTSSLDLSTSSSRRPLQF